MIEEHTQEDASAQHEQGHPLSQQDSTPQPPDTLDATVSESQSIEADLNAVPTMSEQATPNVDAVADAEDEPSAESSLEEKGSTENPNPAPAATANTYRDIIAMRLAEKQKAREASSGDKPAPRPMAHTSEWREGKRPEPASEITPTIESETKAQEVTGEVATTGAEPEAAQSSERASSRERARQRQRERAELRRGGASRIIGDQPQTRDRAAQDMGTQEPDGSANIESELLLHEDESGIVMPIEEAGLPTERPTRQDRPDRRPDGRRREDRPREDRPKEDRPREDRTRGERPPVDRNRPERPERVREERPREERVREDRPREEHMREERVREDRPREERLREERRERAPREPMQVRPAGLVVDRPTERPTRATQPTPPLTPISAKGGLPAQSESGLVRAKALAGRLGISVVIPLYNEQDSLRELTVALRAELYKLAGSRYQIIYVNDGSTDRSADILRDILQMTSRITVLSFRRNMGKSAALAVGFREVKYGLVITMDADLQDDPGELPNLVAKLEEGYDLVTGWKKKRNDPISKTLPSKLFNRVTSFFSGIKLHDFNCGLKAYRKEVTDSLDVYGEMHRYLPALAHWKGFRVGELPVVHHPRKFGKSKFGSSRFFKGFLDLLSIVFTNRYGKRPLHLFGTIGTLLGIFGLGINIWVSVEWAMGLTALSNRPIILLGVLLILVGVQLVSLGLLGEMIVKSTNRSSDFNAVREQGRRLPEDRDAARQRAGREPGSRDGGSREGSSREGGSREGRNRDGGRREGSGRREGPREPRDDSRSRGREPRGDEGEGPDRDGQPRRMGRDRRRRPRD